MSNSGIIGDIGQQLGSIGKKVGQSVAQAPKTAVKTVGSQIGLPETVLENEKKSFSKTAPLQDKETQDFVKELYGATPKQKPEQPKNQQTSPQQQEAVKMAEANPQKTPEEIQQIMALRQKLHSEYYQKLTHPAKRPEEAQEEQERAVERTERLKMEDIKEKQKKDEKKKPITVLQQERKTEAPLGAG